MLFNRELTYKNSGHHTLIVGRRKRLPKELYWYHGDLWRDNILVEDMKISIIDLASIIFGPKSTQFAILSSAYFKLNSILLEEEEKYDLDEMIHEWGEPLEKRIILHLMIIFPIVIDIGKEHISKTIQSI